MDFFIETIKNASLHIHAVWLAIAYIAVILAMTVDFIAGRRKAKHRASRMQSQTCLSIAEAPPMLREANSVLESTHDKQELREAANTFNVIVKNKDDIAAIVTQAMEMMAQSQSLKRDRESREEGVENREP